MRVLAALMLVQFVTIDHRAGTGTAVLAASEDKSIFVVMIDDDPSDAKYDRAFAAKLPSGTVPPKAFKGRISYDGYQHHGLVLILNPGDRSSQAYVFKVRNTNWVPPRRPASSDITFDVLALTRHGVIDKSPDENTLLARLIDRVRRQFQ